MTTWLQNYEQNGYHFPQRVFSADQAAEYRTTLEQFEAQYNNDPDGRKLAIGNANSLIPFVDQITRSDAVLDHVKEILGPNILVWNSSFFIKEAHTCLLYTSPSPRDRG